MTAKQLISVRSMTYIALSVAIMAVCSWISVPLVVPVTLQTMAVFLVSGILGIRRALLTITLYVLLGAIGIPVFAGFSSGVGVLFGPTGGYIFGFFFIALCVGWATERYGNSTAALTISMMTGLILCYAFGTIWFQYVYTQNNGPVGLWTVLGWCVFPFIIPDLVKMIIAITIAQRIRPQLKID